MIIDTHHHLWRYNEKDFPWIDDTMPVIKKDFLSADYRETIKANHIDKTIVVQARQSYEETDFLIEFAEKNNEIAGVIGWVNLTSETIESEIKRYTCHSIFKGVRHVLQDEDIHYMLEPDFIKGLEVIQKENLIYELLIFPIHLDNTLKLVEMFPDIQFVLNHIGKPNIKDNSIKLWKEKINKLGTYPNVVVKLSGMVTEHHWENWSTRDFSPYLDVVWEAFGEDRIMYGSDWPVCLLAASYSEVQSIIYEWSKKLTPLQKDKLFYMNACSVYDIE